MAQIVTITNPLTGQPAQVDQLEHTAQEIDDAIARSLPGGDIDIALQKKADTSVIDQIENDVNVLDSRMNEFTSLPDGSTSGDAELADIRVAANGKTYPNAGDAVRAQYSELKQEKVDKDGSSTTAFSFGYDAGGLYVVTP